MKNAVKLLRISLLISGVCMMFASCNKEVKVSDERTRIRVQKEKEIPPKYYARQNNKIVDYEHFDK